jgi:hypothetical protein
MLNDAPAIAGGLMLVAAVTVRLLPWLAGLMNAGGVESMQCCVVFFMRAEL